MQVLCPVVIGRVEELAGLRAALAGAAEGRGRVVLLTGEAGTGKTRLGRELQALAAARGTPVLAGRAVEGTAPAPYRPLAESLASLVRRDPRSLQDDELAPFRAVLARLVPDWRAEASGAAEPSSYLVGEAMLRLLRHLGTPRGCLAILEDLHWADPDTLAVVEYLADNLGGEPVLVLGTMRAGEGGDAQALAQRLQVRRSIELVELSPLDAEATTAMAQACLGTTVLPEELAHLVWTRSDGVPFLVEEILAALVACGALQKADAGWVLAGSAGHLVPASFTAAVRRRLASLGAAPARVLRAAAVLGTVFDWQLLSAMTGLPDEEVVSGLRRAVEAQLVQPETAETGPGTLAFRFRHALTAEALRGDLLAPERITLARSALAALQHAEPGLPGATRELAASLAEAAGEWEQAAHHLLQAARGAVGLGALATAEAALTRAKALAAQPATGAEISQCLLEVLVLAGRSHEALRLGEKQLERLADDLDGNRALAARLHLARAATQAGQTALAEQYVQAGRRLASKDDRAAQARLHIEAGQVALLAADAGSAAAEAREALRVADRLELACEAWMLLGRALRTSDLAEAAQAFERARALAHDPGLGLWRMLATHELGTIDLFTTNRTDRLLEARALAGSAGALGTLAAIDLHLGVAADAAGAPEEALARARSCAETARRLGLNPLVAIGLALQADVRAMGGARQQVEQLAGQVLALPDATPDARASAWGALARASLCAEDHQRAARELEMAVACVRAHGRTTAPGPYYGYHALLAALRGTDGPGAIAEVRSLGAGVAGWNRGLLGCAEAILAGRAGDTQHAARLAAHAGQALAPYPGYGHLGLRLMAQAAVDDDWGDPGRWLRPALSFAQGRGLTEVASACRSLLRRAGIPVPQQRHRAPQLPSGFAGRGITERELDVLRLIGDGHSNTEIAARLYISVRTAEKHVEALLRKTGLTRRTQLAAMWPPSQAPIDGPLG